MPQPVAHIASTAIASQPTRRECRHIPALRSWNARAVRAMPVTSAQHHAGEAAPVGGHDRILRGDLPFCDLHAGRLDDLEDSDVGLARGLVVPGLVAHEDFQQFVHGVRPALPGDEPPGAFEARVEVTLVGADPLRERGFRGGVVRGAFGGVDRVHPHLDRAEPARAGDLGDDGREGDLGVVHASELQQQLHVVEARIVVRGVGGDGMLELFEGGVGVAILQRLLGGLFLGLGQQFIGAGHVLVEEGADLSLGLRAHEAVHGLAVHHQHAGGNAADAEHAGDLLLLVGIDLHELEAARILGFQLLEDGAERLAGAAPGGPEVHQDGHFHRGGDDLGFEILYGDVDHCVQQAGRAKSKIPGSTQAGARYAHPHST